MPVDKEVVVDVISATICIVCKAFNPEKYNALLQVLFQQYSTTGDPTKILEGYLSVHTTGNYSNGAGTFDSNLFKDTDALLQQSAVRDLVLAFGMEIVVLWNAVLLKKRILIVADALDKLLPVIRSVPQLAWHRKDWSVIRPIVTSDGEHLEDLQSSGVFIAGTIDQNLATRSDMFDVILSLADRHLAITGNASAEMKMCSIHREVATVLTETAEAGGSNQEIILALSKKTATILNQLRGLMPPDGPLTEALINERVTNEAAQQWLYRVAGAEGML